MVIYGGTGSAIYVLLIHLSLPLVLLLDSEEKKQELKRERSA